ncbi:pyrimidine/purine nucleoside phosphorylase, partial [Streptomyces hydrogenans]|uniref:pyrimidine/purine nucleoside phosphorylase n=1 Tax=Streptomyces hydrogenans TaxID=1873719 RepID=UPI0033F58CDC
MFKVNEYFDGTVKSIAFEGEEGPATVGVMAPGDYEFGTAKREVMHVVSGALTVRLPGSDDWARPDALGGPRRRADRLRWSAHQGRHLRDDGP